MVKKWVIGIVLGFSLIAVVIIAAFTWLYHPAKKPVKTAAKKPIKGGGLPPGCVCHSKNQRFVSMHNLFSVRDCKNCHGQGEDLMNRKSSKMTPARKAALEQRMKKEAVCRECHLGGKIIVAQKSGISGGLFCPKDQKIYKKREARSRGGKYYCPKHNVELIDIDEIAIKSAQEPRNEYCIACHPANRALRRNHKKVAEAAKSSSIADCLKCHTSHSKCGGCHF